MIIHNFDPILIDFGLFQVRWYSIAYIAGILIGWIYAIKIIKITGKNTFDFNPIKKDVFQALKAMSEKYNIIFSDPPYDLDKIPEIPKLVFDENLLSRGGWLIVEHSKQTIIKHEKFKETRRYGNVNFSIFVNA